MVDSYRYSFELRSKTDRGKDVYHFETADGVASKEGFREAETLLADSVEVRKTDDILVLFPGYGFLGVLFGDYTPDGRTVLAESSDRAFQISKHNLEVNNIEKVECRKVASVSEIGEVFDKILYAPKPYSNTEVVKNRLTGALKLLGEEGELYLASSKKEGLNRYSDRLKKFNGELLKVNSRNGYHALKFKKEREINEKKLDISNKFKAKIKGTEAEFKTEEGLFSPKQVDEGTRVLLENIEVESTDKVWDICCGYGVIGIFLKKLYDPEVYLTDDSMRAINTAQENLELNSVSNCKLETADCLEAFKNQKFDVIVSNPPTHQGAGITDEIFHESVQRLKKGGELYVVYNKNMKYETKLEQMYEKVEIIDSKDNYKVTKASK